MGPTLSLSCRVSPELRNRLGAMAAERGVPLGTLASSLLAAAVDDRRGPSDSALTAEVEAVFADLPPEAGVHRAVCLALAKAVDHPGGGQVAAAKELLEVTSWARRHFAPDEDEDLDDDLLADLRG